MIVLDVLELEVCELILELDFDRTECGDTSFALYRFNSLNED